MNTAPTNTRRSQLPLIHSSQRMRVVSNVLQDGCTRELVTQVTQLDIRGDAEALRLQFAVRESVVRVPLTVPNPSSRAARRNVRGA